MGESRAGKYGRFGSSVLTYIIGTFPVARRGEYLARFLSEFELYSDLPRKVGNPENEGCVRELDGLEELDVLNPEELARWFKEGQHLKYQKNTTRRERISFLECLKP